MSLVFFTLSRKEIEEKVDLFLENLRIYECNLKKLGCEFSLIFSRESSFSKPNSKLSKEIKEIYSDPIVCLEDIELIFLDYLEKYIQFGGFISLDDYEEHNWPIEKNKRITNKNKVYLVNRNLVFIYYKNFDSFKINLKLLFRLSSLKSKNV